MAILGNNLASIGSEGLGQFVKVSTEECDPVPQLHLPDTVTRLNSILPTPDLCHGLITAHVQGHGPGVTPQLQEVNLELLH